MTRIAARSRIGRALTTGAIVAGIVIASIVGLDGWADRVATHDVAAAVSAVSQGQAPLRPAPPR
ncbi:hypothetical protein QDR37_08780 [Amnibacterium sp. CER49]|uniref:hypothetical protein n=1 Tax=Amnibacterium sp. CER49 TaxID=3039161 RepID=UPI0024488DC2|nr:hypothetical protein [Amnibacterium sp. CER49]MDH2444037.1 hypothetical protein [Amnibacterium sp. CER49]